MPLEIAGKFFPTPDEEDARATGRPNRCFCNEGIAEIAFDPLGSVTSVIDASSWMRYFEQAEKIGLRDLGTKKMVIVVWKNIESHCLQDLAVNRTGIAYLFG
jgi:hypothetical protein